MRSSSGKGCLASATFSAIGGGAAGTKIARGRLDGSCSPQVFRTGWADSISFACAQTGQRRFSARRRRQQHAGVRPIAGTTPMASKDKRHAASKPMARLARELPRSAITSAALLRPTKVVNAGALALSSEEQRRNSNQAMLRAENAPCPNHRGFRPGGRVLREDGAAGLPGCPVRHRSSPTGPAQRSLRHHRQRERSALGC